MKDVYQVAVAVREEDRALTRQKYLFSVMLERISEPLDGTQNIRHRTSLRERTQQREAGIKITEVEVPLKKAWKQLRSTLVLCCQPHVRISFGMIR